MNDSENSVGIVTPQHFVFDEPLALEAGGELRQYELVVETYGQLNSDASNAVLICHALSGNHHAAGKHSPEDTKSGWWDLVIGPGKPIDTDRLFVVSLNNLGGCDGSTGPTSATNDSGDLWGTNFPQVTVSDWVETQRRLALRLGISRWAAVIGGSLGGMQALQWSVSYPDWVEHCVIVAAAPSLTAQNIAFNEIARQAIYADPNWRDGNYLAASAQPTTGMALARMVGHLTYMSADRMSDRFGRDLRSGSFAPDSSEAPLFEVESYLRYQGEQFSTRFDANTYILMTRALDRFDIADEANGDLSKALSGVSSDYLVISFSTDWRFAPNRSRELVDALVASGKSVSYANIESDGGHDAFLLENDDYLAIFSAWMKRVAA